MNRQLKKRGIFPFGLQERSCNRSKRRFGLGETLESVKSVIPIDESIIDIGASFGGFTKVLKDNGYDIFGIDGTPGIEELSNGLVKQHDILDGGFVGVADWGLFLNTGEHIPKNYERQLVLSVCAMARKGLFLAWADHVVPDRRAPNRRSDFYIASVFGVCGWLVDEEVTLQARDLATDYGIMNERILVMRKEFEVKR